MRRLKLQWGNEMVFLIVSVFYGLGTSFLSEGYIQAYMLDLGIPGDSNQSLMHARSTLVAASSAAEINQPVDSVYTDFNDEEGLKEASELSRGFGFQGRLVIHPKQIETVNKVYAPTSSEIEEAEKIVDAFKASIDDGDGAIEVDGKMIDPPVYERAKKLLEM